VPANSFYDAQKDELIFFDQEYYWDNVSADVAITRALWSLKYSPVFSKDSRVDEWLETLKSRYNLTDNWQELAELANAKTMCEVFGNERLKLETMTINSVARINDHTANDTRYQRFDPITLILRERGFARPLIYGFGKRGKTINRVLEDKNIEIAAIYDKKYQMTDSILTLATKTNADIIIVSMWEGETIAADLRRRLPLPVYTPEELLNGWT
jgi:hypothetical protein